MTMGEIADTIRMFLACAVLVCAAAGGVVLAGYALSCGARLLVGFLKKLAALPLVGALLIGGMVVVGTDGVGSKAGTNVVSQIDGGTNTVVRTGAEETDCAGLSLAQSVRGGRSRLAQGLLSGVTDDDIAAGWREVSRRTGTSAASVFALPDDACIWEAARARGARRGCWRIPFGGWGFSGGGARWTNGFIWAEGQFRPRVDSTRDGFVLLDHSLALAPAANGPRFGLDASLFWCRTNAVGGIVGTFLGAALDDDPSRIVNAQFELFPSDGRMALRYDLARAGGGSFSVGPFENGTNHFATVSSNTAEIVFQRVQPDDWDMDGLANAIDDTPRGPSSHIGFNQTEVWALAAFPENSAEIVTTGYAAWAAARAADPDRRLVGLRVSLPDNAGPVCLSFGDWPVMCDGKVEIVFAIDCGARYPFSISGGGKLAFVSLHAGTDTVEPCAAFGYPYERWVNDVLVHLDSPGSGWIERVPEIRVEGLHDTHFFPDDHAVVTAVVTNCHPDAYIGCQWSGGSGVLFSDFHSLETEISWQDANAVEWSTNSVTLVTEYVGGHAVTNVFFFTVGSHSDPETDFTLSCESVQFINDDERRERVYPVVARLLAARNKMASVSFSSDGNACPALFWDDGATIPYDGDEFPLRLPDSNVWFNECRLYVKSSDVGHAVLSATCTVSNRVSTVGGGVGELPEGGDMPPNAQTYSTNCSFRVVCPIRKLVTGQSGANGQIVNPSRIVAGEDAVLAVEAQGPITPTEICWSVTGPGRISQTNDWSVTIVPTADEGTVTVEARFNGDAIQPTFVLPIVCERVLNVKAFTVSKPDGELSLERGLVEDLLLDVNRIYHQAGIRFNLTGYVQLPNSSQYWSLPIQEVHSHSGGGGEQVLSERLIQLLGTYQRMADYHGSDCIELYVVGSLEPRKIAGLYCPGEGIVIPAECSAETLAHELGHALGFEDCYLVKALDENNPSAGNMSLPADMLSAMCFRSRPNDWGAETGYGFYSSSDSITAVYGRLLMCGRTFGEGLTAIDIPDGAVWSVTGNAFGATGIGFVPVGASNVFPDNEQVYTK